MINYIEILKDNMIKTFKDVLKIIEKNGLSNQNAIYITFYTNHDDVKIPNWLKEKFKTKMTIVIQHEYYELKVKPKYFSIILSFDDIKTKLEIGYNSILSFADPYTNFGLSFIDDNAILKKTKKNKNYSKAKSKVKNNIIEFNKYKKS